MRDNGENGLDLFSIGYESYDPQTFFLRLKMSDVDCLVDVRKSPISRKKGFSKRQLDEAANRNSIRYVHFGDLGAPKELREELKTTRNYDLFFEKYREHLLDHDESLGELINLIGNSRSCIMCLEHSCLHCHRRVLIETLQKKNRDIELTLLE